MVSFEVALAEQADALARRVAERTKVRRAGIEVLGQPGGIARADAPERVAARLDRLSRSYADVRPVSPSEFIAEKPAAVAAAGVILERIIGTEDFVGIRYLEGGAQAARAVGRVNIRDARGRVVGYGTGSLVAPEVLLTNHHVLPDARVAGMSTIEFDYQDGRDGRPLAPVEFDLGPQRLFLADQDLDYALVAVQAPIGELARFGFNPLIEAEGKAIVGDFVSIVQHPGGEKKQVALRDNRVVDLLDVFMHYETDTEPGSSGSPVFNDQWEIVALHHASVLAPDHDELGGIVNEGIRVSRLLAHIRAQPAPPTSAALVSRLLNPTTTRGATPLDTSPQRGSATNPPRPPGVQASRVTIPVEITVQANARDIPAITETASEAITIDPDYANRKGYASDFLGSGPVEVPLPELGEDLIALAAINTQSSAEPRYVLPYHHFSVVLNRQRRLAIFTAVNVDGTTSMRLKRERDRWTFDPRVPIGEQTGEEVYRNNPLDRGHLVRRLDPAWGASHLVAKAANDDTFHFTNCTPQHEDFNQNQTTWAGLEDYILENADNRDFKASVFTGPVLADDDETFRGLALPRQFWKVAVMVKDDGSLSATGYLLSQEELIRGLEADLEAFTYDAYRTYQVPLTRIEALTHLSFGTLTGADPLTRLEATPTAVEISQLDQLVL